MFLSHFYFFGTNFNITIKISYKMPNNLFRQYNVELAIAEDHKNPHYRDWVYSVARKVDITNPKDAALVRDLSVVMEQALGKYEFFAVSSNNLHWNATDKPIRVVMVPQPQLRENITLVNPEITGYGNWEIDLVEGCGSFPGKLYVVKRKTFAEVSAHLLTETGFAPVHFEYGVRSLSDQAKQKSKADLEKILDAGRVQHEIDHLDGIVIAKKRVFYGEYDPEKEKRALAQLAMQEMHPF